MDNPFKSIIENEKLPDTMKKKVMNDIALIQLSIEVADLVSIKYPNTIKSFFGIGSKIGGEKMKKNSEDKND